MRLDWVNFKGEVGVQNLSASSYVNGMKSLHG